MASSTTIFYDLFEGNFPGTKWITYDSNYLWGRSYWGLVECNFCQGYRSAWCSRIGDPLPYCDYYDYEMEAYLTMAQPVDLSNYTDCWIRFGISYDIHEDDYLAIYLSEDGYDWYMEDFVCGYALEWDEYWISLDYMDCAAIRFLFFSFDSVMYEQGAYIDDLEILGERIVPPNLAPCTPSGWSGPIVVSSVPFKHTVDTLYAEELCHPEQRPRGGWEFLVGHLGGR